MRTGTRSLKKSRGATLFLEIKKHLTVALFHSLTHAAFARHQLSCGNGGNRISTYAEIILSLRLLWPNPLQDILEGTTIWILNVVE